MTPRLPDFVVIGAAKSGTTSLARWLEQHPQVWVPPEKELRFFDSERRWSAGPEWYRGCFDAAPDDAVAGEATPAYLAAEVVPERLAATVPSARLIAVLRHPVDRAYAHYWHARDWGGEQREFRTVVAAALASGEPDRYLDGGEYLAQLQRYEQVLGDGAVTVLRFEDLVGDPDATFATVCRLIGVDPARPANLGRTYNPHSRLRWPALRIAMMRRRAWQRAPRTAALLDRLNIVPGSYPPMAPDLRDRLLEHYAAGNDRLASHLGLDLAGWAA